MKGILGALILVSGITISQAAIEPIELFPEDTAILTFDGLPGKQTALSEFFQGVFEVSPSDFNTGLSNPSNISSYNDFFAEVVLTEPGQPTIGSDLITIEGRDTGPGGGSDFVRFTFLSDFSGPISIPIGAATLEENGMFQEIAHLFVDKSDPANPRSLPDSFSIQVRSDLPEPSTLALLAVGFFALGRNRLRRHC